MRLGHWSRRISLLAVLGAWSAGCNGGGTGTFVRLRFVGTVSPDKPIQSIAAGLMLGTETATTVFQAPSSSGISLPTSAVLEIQNGDGDFSVSAQALAGDGTVLGIGSGSGSVTRGKTSEVEVTFSAVVVGVDGGIDGGESSDGPPPFDAATLDTVAPDAPMDAPDSPPADAPVLLDGAGGAGGAGLDGPGGRDAGNLDVAGAGGTGTGGNTGGVGTGGASGGTGGGGTGGDTGNFKLVVEPTTVDFGAVLINTTSPALTLVVQNAGSVASPALVTSVTDSIHFSFAQDTCSGVALAPAGKCLLAFTFKPSAPGFVQTDGGVGPLGGAPVRFFLGGTGTSGTSVLTLSPPTVAFGVVDVGTNSSAEFTVTNRGDVAIPNIQVSANGPPSYAIANDGCSNRVLPSLGQCFFTLTFAPQAFGPTSATVTVQSPSGVAVSSSASGTGRDYVPLTIQFAGQGTGVVDGITPPCPSGNPCTISVERIDPTALPKFELVAQPDGLSLFAGWGGDCTGTGTCSVQMDTAKTVVAAFNPRMVPISLTVLGLAGQLGTLSSDDGTISCSGSCPNLSHAATASFTLNAKPGSSGGTFAGWTDGPCKGTNPQCTFALTDPTSVTATFGPQSYMFVSSSTVVPGRLGGIAGGDQECQRLADAAKLPGSYAAWMSDKTTDARGRVGEGGWLRTDGRPFAREWKSLSDAAVPITYYPPRLDEKGNDLGNVHTFVATGSSVTGTSNGDQCLGYTSTTGGLYVGDAAAGAHAWSMTQFVADGCGRPYHLYCFRADASPGEIVPPPQSGRRIFVSTKAFPLGNGADPNVVCQKDAEAAGLPNATGFVAFQATSKNAAIDLVDPSGHPWKRADEVFVVRRGPDLSAGALLAPVDLQADGITHVAGNIWTGATNPTVLGTATCSDWKSSSNTMQALVGDSKSSAAPDWFGMSSSGSTGGVLCSNLNTRLLCVER